MAISCIEVKFPCGYKYKSYLRCLGISLEHDSDLNELPECPLHGKNCKGVKK